MATVPTAEEFVIQNHYGDLQQVIIYPLQIASKLLQEGVVSKDLVSEVNTLGRSQLQNSTAILTAVTASIHSKPDQFQVFMSVLEGSPESAGLARKIRNELSILKPKSEPTDRLLEMKGRYYTVSAEYKGDFINLQDSFGQLYDSLCETVQSLVALNSLKTYLCRTFPEFKTSLQDAKTIDDVMEAVHNESSLTDIAYLDRIVNRFKLPLKEKIEEYRIKLKSFCQHTLDNHTYVRSFREDYPRYILSSDKIVFQLQWKANEKTLIDIRNVLQTSFGHLADRIQIVVIDDGCVIVVCWAPRHLMEELVRQASKHVHNLMELGVVELTVGNTEVITRKGCSSVIPDLDFATILQLSYDPDYSRTYTSIEYQQLVADVERLASDKANLLTRLKCCEEDAKRANECMMAAVHRRDTDVEDRDERICQLEKELDEFRRERLERGERQSLMTGEIDDLKKKLNEAINMNSELASQILNNEYLLKNSNEKINELEAQLKNTEAILISLDINNDETKLFLQTSSKPEKIVDLLYPCGMAVLKEDHLIIAESSNDCVSILNTSNGEKTDIDLEFDHPEGVALTQDGNIIVVDSHNHRLQVLTVEGVFVAAVGSQGSQPLQFGVPYGVAVHLNGKIFVTELYNNRVQVLNPDLSYSHSFGSKGDELGELNYPLGVAIDHDGMVYVSDCCNNRIQKFTPEGNTSTIFYSKENFYPSGLCIVSNNIYVTDCFNNTVSVFNSSGRFLGYIGNSDGSSFDRPCFIVSVKDRLYISDDNGVFTCKSNTLFL